MATSSSPENAASQNDQAAGSSTMVFIQLVTGICIVLLKKKATQLWPYGLTLALADLFPRFLDLVLLHRAHHFTTKQITIIDALYPSFLLYLSVMFNNLALQYNTVPFTQMMALLVAPMTTLLQLIFIPTTQVSFTQYIAFVMILTGVLLSTFQHFSFDRIRAFFGLAGACASAFYSVISDRSRQNLHCSKAQLLYVTAPCAGVLLLVTLPFLENYNFLSDDSIQRYEYTGLLRFYLFAVVSLSFLHYVGEYFSLSSRFPALDDLISHLQIVCLVPLSTIFCGCPFSGFQYFGFLLALAGSLCFCYIQRLSNKNRQAQANPTPFPQRARFIQLFALGFCAFIAIVLIKVIYTRQEYTIHMRSQDDFPHQDELVASFQYRAIHNQPRSYSSYKYVIVGAGLFGSVVAERLAESGKHVLVLDRREHIAGNVYSWTDARTGIEIHKYGSHIFHTEHERVWQYITRFAEFNNYTHTVDTRHNGKLYPMPISLDTINLLYEKNMTADEAKAFVAAEAAKHNIVDPQNFEEKALSLVGERLYSAFLKYYTKKQWHTDPKKLSADILKRIPVRYSHDHRYFMNAKHQGIPKSGYATMVQKILTHPNIDVCLKVEFKSILKKIPKNVKIIYTGMIDELFDYKLGVLPYRSLTFEEERTTKGLGQAVINEADESVPYTRAHDYKYYQIHQPDIVHQPTCIVYREYPADYQRGGEAYYPVNNPQSEKLYQDYIKLAKDKYPNLILGGRLGAYRYWDMDLAIKNALELSDTLLA